MLPKLLFPVYRDDRKAVLFGSKFMTFLGRLFMGSMESKGLGHVIPELRDTYYSCKVDRHIPDGAAREQWFKQSILMSEYRQAEHPQVAKATWMALSAYAVAAVLAVAMLGGVKGASSNGVSFRPAAAAKAEPMTKESCQTLGMNVFQNRVPAYQQPNLDALLAECTAINNATP